MVKTDDLHSFFCFVLLLFHESDLYAVVLCIALGVILCMVEHLWYNDFTTVQTLPLVNTLIITLHIMIFSWA